MAAKGNRTWMQRSKHGKDKKHTPETLLKAAKEYFIFTEDNPIKSQKLFGTGLKGDVDLARPFTQAGFCLFTNISEETYRNYKKLNDYIEVTSEIDLIIYTNKFDGATAGIFNPNIIARDLGLVDKKEVEVKEPTKTKEEIQKELDALGLSN